MLCKLRQKLFIQDNIQILKDLNEVLLVKCSSIDPKLEKHIKNLLNEKGITVKDLWYRETGRGALGIPFAIREYARENSSPFYAVAIRGKKGVPELYCVNNNKGLVKR